jgi:hypothetical protein
MKYFSLNSRTKPRLSKREMGLLMQRIDILLKGYPLAFDDEKQRKDIPRR